MRKSVSIKTRFAYFASFLVLASLSISAIYLLVQEKRFEREFELAKINYFLETGGRVLGEAIIRGDIYSISRVTSKICRDANMKFCRVLDSEKATIFTFPDIQSAPTSQKMITRPIIYTGKTMGWLEMLPHSMFFTFSSRQLFPIFIFALLLTGAAVALFNLFYHRPFRDLERLVTEIDTVNFADAVNGVASLRSPVKEINLLIKAISKKLETALEMEETKHENEKLRSIASVVQMLAHDVRKPFSYVKILMDQLRSAKEWSQAESFVESGSLHIERAIDSVTGMLEDIMEVGSTAAPSMSDIEPLEIIRQSVEDVLRIRPKAKVQLEYDIAHRKLISADRRKIARVFQNVIDNGIQANQAGGKLWFTTRDVNVGDKAMIEFRIGNSGSYVDPEARERMFDPFYTKGKAAGTGLGLAIVKKVVSEHGGSVHCESDIELGTEIIFTLSISDAPSQLFDTSKLPQNSDEARFRIAARDRRDGGSKEIVRR